VPRATGGNECACAATAAIYGRRRGRHAHAPLAEQKESAPHARRRESGAARAPEQLTIRAANKGLAVSNAYARVAAALAQVAALWRSVFRYAAACRVARRETGANEQEGRAKSELKGFRYCSLVALLRAYRCILVPSASRRARAHHRYTQTSK
jgi:hypothetical protein